MPRPNADNHYPAPTKPIRSVTPKTLTLLYPARNPKKKNGRTLAATGSAPGRRRFAGRRPEEIYKPVQGVLELQVWSSRVLGPFWGSGVSNHFVSLRLTLGGVAAQAAAAAPSEQNYLRFNSRPSMGSSSCTWWQRSASLTCVHRRAPCSLRTSVTTHGASRTPMVPSRATALVARQV